MRIMIVSDSYAHKTGYGVQTKLLADAMVKDGHRVFNYAPGAIHGGAYDVGFADGKPTITVLSSVYGDDRWGNQSINYHINAYNPDIILTWLDCQGLANFGFSPCPTYMWAPIDTWPIPKQERAILNRAEKLLVCSKWGQQVLFGHDMASEYVPCGIDMDVYDIDEEEGRRWRGQIEGVDDSTFLIGMVGLNSGSPDRKGYAYAFEVLKAFIDKHPEVDVKVYMHTNPDAAGGGLDMYAMREEFGLLDKVAFARDSGPNFETPQFMRGMYNAFDVLLHTSMTEGFGIPVVEAQACGTPVVVNACTSVTELASAGYKAKPAGEMWIQTATKVAVPDVRSLVLMLEAALADRKNHSRISTRASVSRYDFNTVYDTYWRPLLADVPPPVNYESGEKKLLLAAGKTTAPGFVTHDRDLHLGADVAHDLNVFPYPWEDNEWDFIKAVDILEHLKADLPLVLDELWRILKPTGYLYIHTAEVGSWQLHLDPTHVVGFSLDSFDYFDPKTKWGGMSDYDYTDKKWQVKHKTSDNHGGLIFLLAPRKEVAVAAH